MYASLSNTSPDVEARGPAPPQPRRPLPYDPLNELFGNWIPERYRDSLGSNVPLALTLLVIPTVFAWILYATIAPPGGNPSKDWWPWTMYAVFAPMLGTEVVLCLLQVVRRYAGAQYMGCLRCIAVLEAAGAALLGFQWMFVAVLFTASLFMVIEVGPGPLFIFQFLFGVGAWAMVIIAAYLSGLYMSEACRGRSATSSYSQLGQTDGQQVYSHSPPPQAQQQYQQQPVPQAPQYQPPAPAQAQTSQYVPPTAL